MGAETSRLEAADARYEEWSARTTSTREIAGKAKAELQRRGQRPPAGEALGPQNMMAWWREFQAGRNFLASGAAGHRDSQPYAPAHANVRP